MMICPISYNPFVVDYTCKNELLPIKEVNFVDIGNEK